MTESVVAMVEWRWYMMVLSWLPYIQRRPSCHLSFSFSYISLQWCMCEEKVLELYVCVRLLSCMTIMLFSSFLKSTSAISIYIEEKIYMRYIKRYINRIRHGKLSLGFTSNFTHFLVVLVTHFHVKIYTQICTSIQLRNIGQGTNLIT